MGTEDIFKRAKINRQRRKEELIEQRSGKWLIISEGTETEVWYFNKLIEFLNRHGERTIEAKVIGTGKNTMSVVDEVENFFNMIDKEIGSVYVPYQKVCTVFDKDSFPKEHFNKAIKKSIDREYIPAWSNESFELWFLLHFEYLNTGLNRFEYIQKLNEILKKMKIDKEYKKQDESFFEFLMEYGSLKKAICFAEKLLPKEKIDDYTKYYPATNVVEMVKLLIEETNYKLE